MHQVSHLDLSKTVCLTKFTEPVGKTRLKHALLMRVDRVAITWLDLPELFQILGHYFQISFIYSKCSANRRPATGIFSRYDRSHFPALQQATSNKQHSLTSLGSTANSTLSRPHRSKTQLFHIFYRCLPKLCQQAVFRDLSQWQQTIRVRRTAGRTMRNPS